MHAKNNTKEVEEPEGHASYLLIDDAAPPANGDHSALHLDDRLGGILTVSIGALFLASIISGLLIGLAQMITVHAYAKARGYPAYPRATWREFICATWVSVPALITPGIITPPVWGTAWGAATPV